MSTTKHTPGPWKFRLNHNGTFTLFGDDGNQVLMCDAGLINRDANARLIAAAPELLDALEAITEAYDTSLPEYKVARAAIVKAKGES